MKFWWRKCQYADGYITGYREVIRDAPLDHLGVPKPWKQGYAKGQQDAQDDLANGEKYGLGSLGNTY